MLPGTSGAAPEGRRAAAVVFDFDGTLTDAEAHAPAFLEASRREIARRLGWDEARSRREWPRVHGVVAGSPPGTPWRRAARLRTGLRRPGRGAFPLGSRGLASRTVRASRLPL